MKTTRILIKGDFKQQLTYLFNSRCKRYSWIRLNYTCYKLVNFSQTITCISAMNLISSSYMGSHSVSNTTLIQPTEHSSGCQSRAMTWQPLKRSGSPFMSFLEQWNVLITNPPNFAPVQKPGQCHSPVEFTSRNWINTLGCTTNTLHHTAESSVLSNPFITEGLLSCHRSTQGYTYM